MHLRNVLIGRYPEPRDKFKRSIRCADCGTQVIAKQRVRVNQRPDITVLCWRCARERMIRLNTTEITDKRIEKD